MVSNEKEFYTVGYSERWGRWQVRRSSAELPNQYSLVEDLGPSLKAAYIEADGDFQYLPGSDHISLITEGLPWLFVITDDGRLYAKRVGAPLSEATLLDTDVVQAAVCRGWKSIQFDVDAGLICAYIKATGAYFRAYKLISTDYVWDEVETLTETACTRIDVKRLNDFRLGFYLDNPDRILISERYYIGGTAKTEFVAVTYGSEFNLMSFCREDGEKDPFEVTNVEFHSTTEVWVTGNYPFYSMDPRWDDISYQGTTPNQGVSDWKIEDGILKITLAVPISSIYASLTLKVRGLNRIRFERTPQSRPILPEMAITYSPPMIPFSESASVQITTSLQFRCRPVTIYTVNSSEQVQVGYTVSVNRPFREIAFLQTETQESVSVTHTVALTFHITLSGDIPV